MYRSGRLLVARQLVGTVVKLVGILVVTRIIGPEAYGLFAAAVAVAAVLSTVAIFGVDVHLVRSPPQDPGAEHTAFTVLLASSLTLAGCAFVAAPVLGQWINAPEATSPMRTIALMLPVMVLPVPARARLERELRFGPLAGLDVAADLAVYAAAIPLAVAGAGVWAPVGGFVARHALLLTGAYRLSGYRPRLIIDREHLDDLRHFGSGYSAGKWVSVAGQLINPIVVGRLLGPVGVGHIAMTSRIIEQLGAVKQATVRLATAAFSKLHGDRERLRHAHAEGVLIQVMGAVPLYGAAAFAAPFILPTVFGSEWLPAVELLALLAIAASMGTVFNLAAPILRVLGRNAPVVKLRLWQVGALLVGTMLAVPAIGVSGYGLARMARTIPFLLVNRSLAAEFTPSYAAGVRWLAAFLPMMASAWSPAWLRPLLLLPPLLLLLIPARRHELSQVLTRVIASN